MGAGLTHSFSSAVIPSLFENCSLQANFGAVRMLREVGELVGRRDIRCFGRAESQNFGEARQVIGILLDVETEILQRQSAVPDAFHKRMLHAGCPNRFEPLGGFVLKMSLLSLHML